MPQLILATNNLGKVAEFRDLLAGSGWDVVTPADLGLRIEVEETGDSYAENARLKAEAFASASGLAALGEDSGLEVYALNGEPGPLHHLTGWDGRNQADALRILLDALKDVPPERRTARYHAVVVVVLADGKTLEGEGVEEGLIVDTPAGNNGFGYDPVFYIPELGKTAAQLSIAEKNRVSHRALAVAAVRGELQRLALASDARQADALS
jgi:XTP/dITP diphosphohydrolase